MTKKPRENRVPIMMSDEELAAIDDWRFKNRVATRSDAVRRLCQMGISSWNEIPEIGLEVVELLESQTAAEGLMRGILDGGSEHTNREADLRNIDKDHIRPDAQRAYRILDAITLLFEEMSHLGQSEGSILRMDRADRLRDVLRIRQAKLDAMPSLGSEDVKR